MREHATLAVDLGGTKTAVAVISSSGRILSREQELTCQDGPEQGIEQLERMLRSAAQAAGRTMAQITCAGVGIPAVLEPETDRVIWAPNLKGWRDIDLSGPLSRRLGIPVYIEYDGHTAVLAEWWLGAGRGCQSLVTVIIGTGIGGGMILDGRLYRGANRLAGAAGWFALTDRAGEQAERQRALGHWESLAAGPGLSLLAGAGLPQHPGSILGQIYQEAGAGGLATEGLTTGGRTISCAEIFTAAQMGDPYALELANHLADWVGLGVANIVSLLNPERVILGGGVGSHTGFLLDRIRAVVQRWAQPVSAQSVLISVSQLENDAGLLGAAYGAMLRHQAASQSAQAT